MSGPQILKILFIIFTLFLGRLTLASTAIGKIESLKGRVIRKKINPSIIKRIFNEDEIFMERGKLKSDEHIESLFIDSLVFNDDEIYTDQNSFVKILFVDQTIATISPKSHFKVKSFKDTLEKRSAEFELLKGQINMKINKKAPLGAIKFKTPVASFGVRGTEFNCELNSSLKSFHEKAPIDQVQLKLIEGELEVNHKILKAGDIYQQVGDRIEVLVKNIQEVPAVHQGIFDKPEVILPHKKRKNWQEILDEQQNTPLEED